MTSRTLLLSALSLLLMTACGDDAPAEGNTPTPDASSVRPDAGGLLNEDGGTTPTDGGGIIVLPDGGIVLPDGGVTLPDGGLIPGARVLAFNGTSPQTVYYGQSQTLAFALTGDGAPIAGAPVQFTMQGSGATLGAGSANTNAQGVAQVQFTAGTADANLIVMASADLANPVAVTLQVRVNPLGAATVSVTSAAGNRISVTSAEISLVATAAGQAAPTCAALLAAPQPPSTSNFATLQPLPGSKSFSSLAVGSSLVVYVRGLNLNGLPVAAGCAQGATVVGGGSVSMSVVLTQLPTDVTGDMDALVKVNLSGALPEPYEGYLNLLGSFVSNPAGVAVYYVLLKVDEMAGFTTFVQIGQGDTARPATLEEVLAAPATFGTWNMLSSYVDTLITGTAFGPTYTKIKTVGTDVDAMVRSFEVGTRIHVAKLAEADQLQINEKWQAIVYTWGYDCAAGDQGCRRNAMQMGNTSYAFINENYGATIAHAPTALQSERFVLDLEPHDIPIRYGAIILLAVNELVVPRVTGCTTDCNGVTSILTHVIDCDSLGVSINEWIKNLALVGPGLATLVTPAVIEGACSAGLATAGTYVETKALELVANDVQQLGTAPGVGSGGSFVLVDADKDLKTELLQELSIDVAWYSPESTTVTEEISAPMTGAGRTAASDCGSDLACASTESCQVIPSYLQVQELETTCKRAVGAVAGNQVCSNNGQCRSGLCVSGLCFQACDADAQCGVSTCDLERASVNLNAVLAGLGSAPAQGCRP